MPRSSAVSKADQQLIAYAARHSEVVTARQLERWRAGGLLEKNIQSWPGHGGSTAEPPPGAEELVVWLARNAHRGRRPRDLALLAFAAGLAVPEDTVRSSFTAAVTSIKLSVEANMPGSAPEDVADAALAARPRVTMVPARIRRIDHDLAKRGMNWSLPKLAELDPGRMDDRWPSEDVFASAVELMLGGGGGIDLGAIGDVARTMAPVGGFSPLAGQVKYRWPISRGKETGALLDDDLPLALLGSGDLRDQLRDLAETAPAAELRDAFQLAALLPRWAADTCAAVEQEIASGQLGKATEEWIASAVGLSRMLMVSVLQGQNAGTAAAAASALTLILVRNKIRTLRQLIPAENLKALDNQLGPPSLLVDFFLDR